jgi:lipid-A-disaccharide synthase
MPSAPCIVVVAGEASGDQLGAALITALRARRPELRIIGIAGPAMRAAGCEPLAEASELAVMGLAEVVRHLPRILGLRRRLLARVLAERPVAYVGIDAPDFNLPVERRLRAAGIRTVHYVCPSVWAWRSGRVRVLRAACDRVLCLLPFEAPFLARAGVPGTFVGHPFADQIEPVADPRPARRALGLGEEGRVVGLLPGSRLGEVTRLAADFLGAARLLAERFPGLRFAAPMAGADVRAAFEAAVAASGAGLDLHVVDGRPREVMAASDVVLAASGTVTLEAMLVGRPIVAAYRFAPLTYHVARALNLVKVRYFSLPNLLADAPLVPEFLQDAATPGRLADAVGGFLADPARRAEVTARFARLHADLRRDASVEAARATLATAGLD